MAQNVQRASLFTAAAPALGGGLRLDRLAIAILGMPSDGAHGHSSKRYDMAAAHMRT